MGEEDIGEYNSTIIPLTEYRQGGRWMLVPDALHGKGHGSLYAVVSSAGTGTWAVGAAYNVSGQNPLIEHWNGRAWTRVPFVASGEGLFSSGSADNQVWVVGSTISRPPTAIRS